MALSLIICHQKSFGNTRCAGLGACLTSVHPVLCWWRELAALRRPPLQDWESVYTRSYAGAQSGPQLMEYKGVSKLGPRAQRVGWLPGAGPPA